MSSDKFVSGSDDKTIALCGVTAPAASHNGMDGDVNMDGGRESIVLVSSMSGHSSDVNDVAWDDNTKQLASASDDATAIIWSSAGEVQHRLVGHQQFVIAVQWSPVPTTLAKSLLAT
jgi:WD40 repeat protein